MAVITLTSDWGHKDHYLGAVKGNILSKLPDVTIVDISHEISPFNLKEASFILRNVYQDFPPGTIHIIALNTTESGGNPHTIVYIHEQYFIGTDNGIFSLIFDEMPDKMVELDILQDSGLFTFATRDRFVKAAVHLAEGKKMEDLGAKKEGWEKQTLFNPVVSGNEIRGLVIYIDNYENVITNITEKMFLDVQKGRKFIIEYRGETLRRISKSYLDVPVGEIVALFGSTSHLEIALNQGNASSLLGLYLNDPVRIEFFD